MARARRLHVAGWLLAGAALGGPAAACINEVGTNLRGEPIDLMHLGPELLEKQLEHRMSDAALAQRLREVTERARSAPGPDAFNNLAAVLIRANRPAPAARLLESLEATHPGRYSTAANLGTAYELLGRNQDALRWIREGIARNPDSHEGTEWLHVRILEAKLAAGERGPDPARSLAGLDFGTEVVPVVPPSLPQGNDGRPVGLYALGLAFRYQVLERSELVPAPDAVVASLMRDWADLEMLAGSIETAELLYRKAGDYGAPGSPLVARRRAEIARVLVTAPKGTRHETWGECVLCTPPAD